MGDSMYFTVKKTVFSNSRRIFVKNRKLTKPSELEEEGIFIHSPSDILPLKRRHILMIGMPSDFYQA
jgi:hypothetical protein